jgi:sulfur-carrier protein adenylyltransferase/sulfurtransferase
MKKLAGTALAEFDYETAFSRNIGWVTAVEQGVLRGKRVAIGGMGGVGGSHLLTLTRLGIGAFHLADFDRFEIANFNRQAGASLATIGLPKVEVLAAQARDINPTLDVRIFPEGIQPGNLEAFLDDVDIYVDGLDFFVVGVRRAVFAACAERGIPAVTAAPLGMGVALLNFLPGGMSFEDYFRLEGMPEDEQLRRFLLGLSPAMLQRGYLVDRTTVDFARHRGPSTPMACELCAGVAATQVLKILLGRGDVLAAPRALQFDAYRNRMVRTWRPGGNRNPLQRLGLAIMRRQLARMGEAGHHEARPPADAVEQILEAARWAPSGDNAQPWRFEVRNAGHVVVHGHDTREHCVYDLRGHASELALGALLETLRIAATRHGLRASWTRRPASLTFDVRLEADAAVGVDPLASYIPLRATQRRPMRTRPLTARERAALEHAAAPDYRVVWLEGMRTRARVARLLFANAGIRLTIPEAYEVHRSIIEWGARYSADRIPAGAVGFNRVSGALTRWALGSWRRVSFLNRYLGGTLLPRLELDVAPALACAGHFALIGNKPPTHTEDFLAAGAAVQRFWLTATRLALWVQPEMTPLIFQQYLRDGVEFSHKPGAMPEAARIAEGLAQLLGSEASHTVFLGRIGAGPAPTSRSLRRPLEELLIEDAAGPASPL